MEVCPVFFKNDDLLNDEDSHSEVDNSILNSNSHNFKCDICYKIFPKLKNLKRHQKLHSSIKGYKCDKCDASYTRSDHLRRHSVIHQEDPKPFHCELCIQRFGNKTHLKRHIFNIHTKSDKDKEEYKCEKCEMCFIKKSKFSKHKWTHHKETKNLNKYKCYYPFCHNLYYSKGKLESHVEKIHENKEIKIEKKYLQCPFENCVKSYTTPYNLKVHIKTFHYKLEEFKCLSCDTTFKHKCTLDKHQAKFHPRLDSNSQDHSSQIEISV